jgi:hypothetical protein
VQFGLQPVLTLLHDATGVAEVLLATMRPDDNEEAAAGMGCSYLSPHLANFRFSLQRLKMHNIMTRPIPWD